MKDKEVLRHLASQVAEIAALPVQKEKKRMWEALNSLKPERPMFTISQVTWHEMNVDNELTLRCQNSFLKGIETELRRKLYVWHHMRDDILLEPHINIPIAIEGIGFRMEVSEEIKKVDENNNIVNHAYKDQLNTEEDLEKL